MGNYILKRILIMIPTLVLISLLVFIIVNLAPGRPGQAQLGGGQGESASGRSTGGQRANYVFFKKSYALDRPMLWNTRFNLDEDDVLEMVELVSWLLIEGAVASEDEDADELARDPNRPNPGVIIDAQEDLEDWGRYAVPHLYTIAANESHSLEIRSQALATLAFNAQNIHLMSNGDLRPSQPERQLEKALILVTRTTARMAYRGIALFPAPVWMSVPTEALSRTNVIRQMPRYDVINWTASPHDTPEHWAEVLGHWEQWMGRNAPRYEYDFWECVGIFFTDTRLAHYWWNLIHFNFGVSSHSNTPVTDVILEHWQYSIYLSLLAVFFAYFLSVPIGLYSAVKQGGMFDQGVGLLLFLMYSLPSFFVATLLQDYLTVAREPDAVTAILKGVVVFVLAVVVPGFVYIATRDRSSERRASKKSSRFTPRSTLTAGIALGAALLIIISNSVNNPGKMSYILLFPAMLLVIPGLAALLIKRRNPATLIRRIEDPVASRTWRLTALAGTGLAIFMFMSNNAGLNIAGRRTALFVALAGLLLVGVPKLVARFVARNDGSFGPSLGALVGGLLLTFLLGRWALGAEAAQAQSVLAVLVALIVVGLTLGAWRLWRSERPKRLDDGLWIGGAIGLGGFVYALGTAPKLDLVVVYWVGLAVLLLVILPVLAMLLGRIEAPEASGLLGAKLTAVSGLVLAFVLFKAGWMMLVFLLIVLWPLIATYRRWRSEAAEHERNDSGYEPPWPVGRWLGTVVAGGVVTLLLAGVADFFPAPVSGFSDHELSLSLYTTWTYFKDVVVHLVLPVFCLTYGSLAVLSRYARTGLLDVVRSDYIRTARAKGLSEPMVIMKHALRNGMIPILTLLATTLPALIGGSVIIEYIFNIPGLGQLILNSVFNNDFNVIMGVLQISALLTLIGILLSDISYALVDPRITFD